MSLIHMTVKALRATAKANGLTGYSRMVKSELVELIASNTTAHKIGDVVRNTVTGRVGTVSYSNDAAVTVMVEDGGPTMSGEHYMFTFTGTRNVNLAKRATTTRKGMNRYSHWAMSFPLAKGGDGNVMQGHADYCAEYGHATEKSTDLNGVTTVAGHCPRCGDLLKTAEQVISELDALDHRQVVDVMRQVVDNGREDLIPVLDKIDAAQCQEPTGEDSAIPSVTDCEKCCHYDTSRCDACVLAWLAKLFNIMGDVTLAKLPAVVEFDCYA